MKDGGDGDGSGSCTCAAITIFETGDGRITTGHSERKKPGDLVLVFLLSDLKESGLS